ncbi:MAG: hypothetical protein GQ535_05215 [Rhodobacteraceae bacterium]|nr:hypothetical protein [Paracoccaceae bacterium]
MQAYYELKKLKTNVWKAMTALSEREYAAALANDKAALKKIWKAMIDLEEISTKVDAAYRKYMLSPEALDVSIASLQKTVRKIKKNRKQMEDLDTTLKAVARLLELLTGVVKLIT